MNGSRCYVMSERNGDADAQCILDAMDEWVQFDNKRHRSAFHSRSTKGTIGDHDKRGI